MSTTIKIRRDTAARWSTNNPTPASGEFCIVTDATPQILKIGDGVTAFNSLPKFTLPNVTTTLAGLMTAADKVKLNGIATGAINAATATNIVLETVGLSVGMAVLVELNIPSGGEYTLCSSADLKLMVIDGLAYTTGQADLEAGTHKAAFVFADPTTIPANAFESTSVAETVHIPSYVHSIGAKAFYGTAVAKVFCESMTPPAIEADSFDDMASLSVTVHNIVLADYQAASVWSDVTDFATF